MARPTKEQIAKRESIKDLGLFVRDSEIYTYFEDEALKANTTPSELSYHFCMECEKRTDEFIFDSSSFMGDNLNINIKNLYLIDFNLGSYFEKLYTFGHADFFSNDNYCSETYVYRSEIETILNRKIPLDCGNDLVSLESITEEDHIIVSKEFFEDRTKDIFSYTSHYKSYDLFTDQERETVKEHYKNKLYGHESSYLTLITKNNRCELSNNGLERNVFAELDLTKPLEELVEFVTTLKNDYDQDPQSISNFHRLIGMELVDHKCSTQTCEIYKHNNLKPLSGRLMDVLFVYDCYVAGFHVEYAVEQIQDYWFERKDISLNKSITNDTVRKYRKFAIEYIEEKEYKNFIKGYVLPID